MSLSNELISQFVKVTQDKPEAPKESTAYGTTVEYGGKIWVRLDGSELLTPVSTTTNMQADERVTVTIKNHQATVTGNLSSPAARTDDLTAVVATFDIIVANKVSTDQLDAQVARIDTLVSENVTIQEKLTASEADISDLQASNANISERLTASEAAIGTLEADILTADEANLLYATIDDLVAATGRIYNLESTYVTTTVLDAAVGRITDLEAANVDISGRLAASEATINSLDANYANINFSNIGEAAIQKVFSDSGIIKDLIVSEGKITGELVGVTIKGDLIEAGTLKTDRLVVKGSDGNYYAINTDFTAMEGVTPVEEDEIHGSVLVEKSIVAEKIAVEDLVAFGATIGGFHITSTSLYSGVKGSVDNTTQGIYLDSSGQFAFGDETGYVKYYADAEGNHFFEVSADSLRFGTDKKTVDEAIDSVDLKAGNAHSLIQQLSESLSMLITDGNGTSLMTQTETGWTFSTSDIQAKVDETHEGLDTLTNELGDTNSVVNALQSAVGELGEIGEYVKIGTYEDEPCIELGESDSDFKLIITNTRILFMEGANAPAYMTNQSLYIKKAVVEEELQQGGFVWKVRANGNLGLMWKGVTSNGSTFNNRMG